MLQPYRRNQVGFYRRRARNTPYVAPSTAVPIIAYGAKKLYNYYTGAGYSNAKTKANNQAAVNVQIRGVKGRSRKSFPKKVKSQIRELK